MGQRVIVKPSEMPNFSGFGKQEGSAKVEGARYIAVQHQQGEANGGRMITPYFALQLDEIYVDSDMKPIDDAAAVQFDVIVCWGSKAIIENQLEVEPAKPLFRFYPANGTGPDDMNPVDVGISDTDDPKIKLVEIGAEGNMIVSAEGDVPQAKTDFGIFMGGLEKKAFKADILGRGYAPDLVGMVYEFKTSLKVDVCKKLGINYTPPKEPRKDKKGNVIADTCREITNILVRPYEQAQTNSAKAKGVIKGATPAQMKEAVKGTASASAPASNGSGDQAKIDAAVNAFVEANKGAEFPTLGKFIAALGSKYLIKAVGMKPANDYTNALKKLDADGLGALGMEFGFTVDGDKIVVNAD